MLLRFDAQCPVCRSFAGLLQRKLTQDGLRFEAMPQAESAQAREFELHLDSGEIFFGEDAVRELATRIPRVKDFFWMLPATYRTQAAVRGYRWLAWLRRFWGRGYCPRCP